jgi:hypothetical protein
MSWYINQTHTSVNLFVFELDANGMPTNNIIYSELNVANTGTQWQNYEFPAPIPVPNGFYMALSHNTANLSLGLNYPTDEYPFMPNTHFGSSDYEQYPFSAIDGTFTGNFMIRAIGKFEEDDIKFGYPDEKALTGYNVYRFEKDEPENDWDLVGNNITGLTFTDADWSDLPYGEYNFAVKALYSNDVISKAVISNILPKDMFVDYQVNINTNSGQPATGATVKLVNINEPNLVYVASSGADGIVVEGVKRGIYNLTVVLNGYQFYSATELDITEAGSHAVNLTDIIYPVT